MTNPFRHFEEWFRHWLHGHRARPRPVIDLRATLHQKFDHPLRRRHLVTIAALKWTNPTTRVDGSPLAAADIASVDIFDTASPGAPIGTVTGGGNTFVTGVLSVGDHNFTAVVTDTAGHKSDPSNVASGTVVATLANPAAISDLSVVLSP